MTRGGPGLPPPRPAQGDRRAASTRSGGSRSRSCPSPRPPDYRFNPFDLTKVWPHGDYPPIEVGRMVLDRNPENFFAEVEQAGFSPANLVPGIGLSPDKMLMGRIFSYHDTHLHRIGANYEQLPVNAPKVEVHSYNKDGAHDLPPRGRAAGLRAELATAARWPTRRARRTSAGRSRAPRSAATPTRTTPRTTTSPSRARCTARS